MARRIQANIARRLSNTLPGSVTYGLAELRGDVFGGVAAGILMLPLAIGYGAISGLGPVAGLYGAIAVAFFTAVFGGTRGLISGPGVFSAVAMSIVVAEYTSTIAEALTVAMLSGLIQVAFGILGLGRYVSYLPYSVFSGFFTAAGILLIAMQILPALGSPPVGGGVMENIGAWPEAVANVNLHAVALCAISLVVTLAGALWRHRRLPPIPTQLAALVVGTLVGMFWLRDAPVIGVIPFGLPSLHLPILSLGLMSRVLEPAFGLALLSSVDALVVALRVDTITGAVHRANREIVGQGIGNMAAGLIGGLLGGVNSAGSLVNVSSGGRSLGAGLVATLVMLSMMVGLGPIAERIPLAVISGILIATGVSIIDWRFISCIRRVSRRYAFVMLMTVFLAVFVGFVNAILVGMVASALIGLRRSQGVELSRLISVPLLDDAILDRENTDAAADPFEARSGLVVFPHRVSVASARELVRIVGQDIGGHQIVIFDLSKTVDLDETAAVMIGQLIKMAMVQHSRQFVIAGLTGDAADTLNSMKLLAQVPPENFAANLDEAKQIIKPMLLHDRPGSLA